MIFSNSLETTIRKITQVIALVGLSCLLIQATMIVVDVLLRWVFNSPLFGMEDIIQLLISVILASFFPILLIDSKNITIDVLGEVLGARTKAWLDVVGQLTTLILFVLVVWQLTLFSIEVNNQTTLILQLPIAPSWWLTTGLMSLCIPAQLVVTVSKIRKVLDPNYSSAIADGRK
jgi:TRAP-type C4-dicarboxylate transport system permease small subunit